MLAASPDHSIMQLPHYMSIPLWISYITIYANAHSLWFPYEVPGNFLHDVQSWQPEEVEYAPPRVSPPANPKGFRRYFGSASSIITDPDVQAFKYFQTAYSNPGLDDPDRTSLLQQAMKYLAQKEDISPVLLESWCRSLGGISRTATGEQFSIILYGLHTLLLGVKYDEKPNQYRTLFSAVEPWRYAAIVSQYSRLVDSFPTWNRAILEPENGLSDDLLSWSFLNAQLRNEPRLKALNKAMSKRDFDTVLQELESISAIFSSKPVPKELSSHTRVAAIALLFHVMHTPHDEVNRFANSIAQLILHDVRNFYLFQHEGILLERLFNSPEKQVPKS
ncbi:hypothetical protein PCANC_18156 [Puccinia coronata f. sp. avenae]|uniref:Uncharacterized protein n=1 Tax=Puccinia coronata f. sp. avenae TaxID=200324 RepID=A0A2N5SHM8_9BASI|nr:hypothetical protein PCANC_18156 [Puccinia coronata f. sp. avenae]